MDCPSCAVSSVGQGQALFLLLLQTLSHNYCQLGGNNSWPKDYFPKREKSNEYDFIVVGSGSAGAIVASRLSENPKWKILLIEAGGDPPMESNIPVLFSTLWNTKYDWDYVAEASNNYGRSLIHGPSWTRGKMLGGSSSLNSMIYLRGFAEDFNRWAALGNQGWDYDSVEPFFQKFERNMATNQTNSSLGTRGPVKIDYPFVADFARYVVWEAAQEKGYPWATDFNGGDQIGYSNTQSTISGGIRSSTATSFLIPAANRKNLHVIKYSQVTKLVLDRKRVVGVQFERENSKKTFLAKANKEVILSAGTVNTPQILMNTGIGPKKHLREMGIKVLEDLPVGRNLQDHVQVFQFAVLPNTPFNVGLTPDQTLDVIYSYLKNFGGPFGGSGLDFIGFINTKEGPTAKLPNAEILHAVLEPKNFLLEGYLRHFRYQQHHIQELLEVNQNATIVIFLNILALPKSRGKIELRNGELKKPPKIFPNYLDHEEDLEILAESMKFNHDLMDTAAMRNVGAKLLYFKDIPCPNYPSLEYFKCYARHFSSTIFHPVGTAKMGPASDPEAVVDSKLRVKNLNGLRVCDASIMPVITSANVQAPVMMIGEKCADFIKEKYN